MGNETAAKYEGSRPYAYVCYAPGDAARVMPVLRQLCGSGYRIWYEDAADTFTSDTAMVRLAKCAAVLVFLSPNFAASGKCQQEIYFAADHGKPLVAAFLEDTELSERIKEQITDSFSVRRNGGESDADFAGRIGSCPDLEPCRGRVNSGKNPEADFGWLKGKGLLFGAVAALIALLAILFFTVHIWSNPSCTEPAVCRLCGKERAAAAGHDWQAATCEIPKSCRVCGVTQGKALGHQWTSATCSTPGSCTVCGARKNAAVDHQWVAATCTEPETCRQCGTTRGNALGHSWKDATYDAPKTCTLCGLTQGDPLDSPALQLQKGDIYRMGSYEQDNKTENGAESIEWIVLEVYGDKALLLSRYGLDCRQYHHAIGRTVTWESCTLRSWLNGTFLDTAFTEEERGSILLSYVFPDENPTCYSEPGESTEDYLFLLSLPEAEVFLLDTEIRICYPTAYAQAQGSYLNPESGCGGWWWLRTPGSEKDFVSSVNSDGAISYSGSAATGKRACIRPAMWIVIG